MATTTPNFGWPVPTSTDYVKNGATAMESLGDAIDASLVHLKGGTTGQVLSKTSNTDMAFTWTTFSADITAVNAGTGISGGGTSGDVTITNSMATAIDAKGDLVAGTGADTFARLAVGSDGQALTADSTQSTGLKWSTLSSGAGAVSQIASGTLPATNTLTISSLSTYSDIWLLYYDAKPSANDYLALRVNNNSGTNYPFYFQDQYGSTTKFAYDLATYGQVIFGNYALDQVSSTNNPFATGMIHVTNAKTTGFTNIEVHHSFTATDGGTHMIYLTSVYTVAEAVSSLVLKWYGGSATFAGGSYKVWAG